MKKYTDDIIIAKIERVLKAEPAVAAAYIFGSFGTDRFNSDSDIDIGVLYAKMPGKTFDKAYFELKGKLEEAVGNEVDLVILNSSSPILCMQVLKHGRKIFEKDTRTANEFFVRTVGSYADLKKVRSPIEQRVLEGKLYDRS